MTHEDEQRAIDLADAAGRAMNNGLMSLAEKLTVEAEKLLAPAVVIGPTFEEWAAGKSLNTDKHYSVAAFSNVYSSKRTQEFLDCWLTAGGVPVK